MQNQSNNEPNNGYMNGQPVSQENSKKSTRQYAFGIVTGMLATLAMVFVVVCAANFLKLVWPIGLRGGISGYLSSGDVSGVTDDAIIEKLETLEDTIGEVFWKDVSPKKLEEGLYRGMLDALDDPYSVYYTNEELVALQQQTEGIYYGIGAYIQDGDSGYVQVSGVIKNTPAEESGLEQGDYIYKVDGEDMHGRDKSYVVSKIKGDEHTTVALTLIRDGEAEPLEVDVERRKIESPTVEYKMYENDMAYISIAEFDLVTTRQFENAYKQAKADGMKGLILDLRSNPGGSLSTVCDIARMILPKGLIVYTEDKYGKREEYTCKGNNKIEVPLVVLTNDYSASASEILAGAIKDYNIGTLVGTTTFGKGIVQKVINLYDGSAIKLTVSSYFTPGGNNIHGIGIDPDVRIEFDSELYKKGTDNQLEKAKEVLAGMMK